MTRKDTILIAVVINAGLLAILFATAMIYDTDQMLDQADISSNQLVEVSKPSIPDQSTLVASAETSTEDEVDNVLISYSTPTPQNVGIEVNPQIIPSEHSLRQEIITLDTPSANQEQSDFIEVTVKKGDSLDKIARANGSSIEAIKKASQLKSEKLKIGQVLKIPKKEAEAVSRESDKTEVAALSSEAVYYTVKSGDSPWKIAKKNKLEYEDILKLNDMDEEKARNLKIGDKIRIK